MTMKSNMQVWRTTRSLVLACALAALSGSAVASMRADDSKAPAAASPPKAEKEDLLTVKINSLEGEAVDLEQYRGKVLLIVNVASKCGYTPQYAKLERLHQRFKDKGLVVIGVPSNDFGGQEPGSSTEIRDFCTRSYSITFPLMEKSQTKKGDGQSELYRVLESKTGKLPTWNFGKYLVSRSGEAVSFHGSSVDPESDEMVKAVESLLAEAEPKTKPS
ncbi:MAG: glutathione peroxidase [Phycisphaeraceae bacterium]|nr:glutathione peroxidase [Phycisphaeraceae bacterium]